MIKRKCFIKRPDSGWYATNCSTALGNLQKLVGGYIETVTFQDLDVVVVCNEESLLRRQPYCCTICGVQFHGDVVVFRPDGDDLTDVQYTLKEWRWKINGD